MTKKQELTKNIELIDNTNKSKIDYITERLRYKYVSHDNMLDDTIRLHDRYWSAGATKLDTAGEQFKKYRFLNGSDNFKDVVAISLYGTKDWKTSDNSYLRTNDNAIKDVYFTTDEIHIFSIDVLPNKLRRTKGIEKGWYYLQTKIYYHDEVSNTDFSKYFRFGQDFYPNEGCWKRLYMVCDSKFMKNDKYGKAAIDYNNYNLKVTKVEISLSFWDADNPNDVLDYGDFYIRKPMLSKSTFKTDYAPSIRDLLSMKK